jgi:chemotaxis protein methyltransferase CheR
MGDRALRTVLGFLEAHTGIRYPPNKQSLVVARLVPRVRQRGLPDLDAYVAVLARPDEAEERAFALDALTTHETRFFREPGHYEWLDRYARETQGPLRVLSAASSTGEEAYSAAMVLAERRPLAEFEVFGVDVAPGVVERAKRGLYPLAAASTISADRLRRWCLRGTGVYQGYFSVAPPLRQRVRFRVANLMEPLRGVGTFDVIFLRNVLIYFDAPQRAHVVETLMPLLRTGGHLLLGHSESGRGLDRSLRPVGPSVLRREDP